MSTSQRKYDVRFDWGRNGISNVGHYCPVSIVVDVLSFSTCLDIACSRGAQVFPYPYKDDTASEFARKHQAILAGSRSQSGPSLSPQSLLNLELGMKLVLPSPNGATLSLLGTSAHVFAGCLRNAQAVSSRAQQAGSPIAVIAAAELWPDGSSRFALEDLVGAGAIIQSLKGSKSPEALLAETAFLDIQKSLLPSLRECVSGVELIEKGFPGDVDLAAQLNVSQCLPELRDGCYYWEE